VWHSGSLCIRALFYDAGAASAPDQWIPLPFWRFGVVIGFDHSVDLPNVVISGLNRRAQMLAVYASLPSLPAVTQDSLPAGGQPWPDGYCYSFAAWVPLRGFCLRYTLFLLTQSWPGARSTNASGWFVLELLLNA